MNGAAERVLVTGATGFVGAYLLQHLLRDPARAVALLLRPKSDTWRIAPVDDRVTTIRGSLDDTDALEQPLREFQPDTIVHLAWNGVGPSDRNAPTQLDNITHSVDLLRLAQSLGVRHWIATGSQAEYGPQTSSISERDPTQPTTLYGACKLSACHLSRLVCNEYGMRFVWLRVFSTYGPKDHDRWLIPHIILTLLRKECPSLTAGQQLWDYLHVDDIAGAVCAVAQNPDVEGVFNVGSGKVVAIRRVAERIRDLIDPGLGLGLGKILYRPDQTMHLEADISQLQKATGWSPQVSLSEGLMQTVEWYRENQHRYIS